MALIIIEGLDRAGKSTVARYFETQGHKLVHLSAPAKELQLPGYTGPSYLDQMMEIIQEAAHSDIVLDRSHYGELIWPNVYNRKPNLDDDDIDVLREIEEVVGVTRIMMHDPDVEKHWQRCIDNKEPLTKAQFARARSLYSSMAMKYGFELVTLPQFLKKFNLDETQLIVHTPVTPDPTVKTATQVVQQLSENSTTAVTITMPNDDNYKKTPEQLLLEKANAINDILEKRILKQKGTMYDELETEIRQFLNLKLGSIFGNVDNSESLTGDEVKFFKAMFKRALEKSKSE